MSVLEGARILTRTNVKNVSIEDLKYEIQPNAVLEDIGVRHLDVFDRNFKLGTMEFHIDHEPGFDLNKREELGRQKAAVKNDLDYMKRLLWIRERYVELIKSGVFDGEKMTQEDFMMIFGIDKKEYYGIAYSVFFLGEHTDIGI